MVVKADWSDVQEKLKSLNALPAESLFLRFSPCGGEAEVLFSSSTAWVSFEAESDEEVKLALGKDALSLLSSLPQIVSLEADGNKVRVETVKGSYTLPASSVPFPPHPDVKGIDFTLPFSSLQKALRLALQCVSRYRSVSELVLLEGRGEGVEVCATNGYRMFWTALTAEVPPFSFLLSRVHAYLLTKVMAYSTAGVTLFKDQLVFSFPSDLFLSLPAVNAEFPPHRSLIEKVRTYPYRVRFGTVELREAVSRLRHIGDVVYFSIEPGEAKLSSKERGEGVEVVSVLSNGSVSFGMPFDALLTILNSTKDSFIELVALNNTFPLAFQTSSFSYYFTSTPQ